MANHKASRLPLNKHFAIKCPHFYKCEGLVSICAAEIVAQVCRCVLNGILWQLGRRKAAMRLLNDWFHL